MPLWEEILLIQQMAGPTHPSHKRTNMTLVKRTWMKKSMDLPLLTRMSHQLMPSLEETPLIQQTDGPTHHWLNSKDNTEIFHKTELKPTFMTSLMNQELSNMSHGQEDKHHIHLTVKKMVSLREDSLNSSKRTVWPLIRTPWVEIKLMNQFITSLIQKSPVWVLHKNPIKISPIEKLDQMFTKLSGKLLLHQPIGDHQNHQPREFSNHTIHPPRLMLPLFTLSQMRATKRRKPMFN